ncbi:hypothetical protein HXX76_014119 [Chlamydomonas incerta]|uniref:Uncharacterized protein n=1 Tax=Chlamydomonas incerta TaxID=51695 RepID=A0A835VTQ3_CHLIN|nr:hypothetical protein HXX76_014119 [Chlamydomonas incerta]|eukprot:KAG2424961.1 hypothetical protein HXX76_014119 [Chlamydomonas incerta]
MDEELAKFPVPTMEDIIKLETLKTDQKRITFKIKELAVRSKEAECKLEELKNLDKLIELERLRVRAD